MITERPHAAAPAPLAQSGSPVSRLPRRFPLVAFVAPAYVGSWIVELPTLLAGTGALALSPGLKFLLSVLAPFAGPTLAAFVVTAAVDGKAGVRALLGRFVRWRFGWPWHVVALAGPPLVLLASVAAVYGAGALPPLHQQGFAIGAAYMVTLAINFFIGGIVAEETGWRGFALLRLQERYGALVGSLILGALWGPWHLPLILTPGNTTWAGGFALFVALGIALAVIHSWVFNGTRGSLLSVMLLHASINTSTRFILPNVPGMSREAGNLLLVVVYGAVALLVVALTRGRLASRHGPASSH